MDDFHNQSSIRYQGDNPVNSYIDYAFNLDILENEILLDIAYGKTMNKSLHLLNIDTINIQMKENIL